ncbi:MAG: hypothetical protein ACR2PI_02500 [Hyphomicrobiaceae bacterium]
MRSLVSSIGLALATAALYCVTIGNAAAFQNGRDAQIRAEAQRAMQMRALRQRLNIERNSRRVQNSIDRTKRAQRRARRRALPSRR